MLTKDFQRTFVPAVPAQPEVPYRAAYTVCQQPPAPGRWEQKCTRIEIPAHGGVQIPPGGELVVVYDPSGAIDPTTGQVKVIDSYIRVCTAVWVASGPPGAVVCTTYPEQPHVPASPGQPSRMETSAHLGWSAGANSEQAHAEDCVCTFTMARVVGVVVGLTQNLDNVIDYGRLSHAMYFHGGSFNVMEGGAVKSQGRAYSAGDEFKIRRAKGEVTYLHNGQRVYTSRSKSHGMVNVGCALYASGDGIE